jgi:hypothetical protein
VSPWRSGAIWSEASTIREKLKLNMKLKLKLKLKVRVQVKMRIKVKAIKMEMVGIQSIMMVTMTRGKWVGRRRMRVYLHQ